MDSFYVFQFAEIVRSSWVPSPANVEYSWRDGCIHPFHSPFDAHRSCYGFGLFQVI